MLRYVTDDLDAALPELEAGQPAGWLAKLLNRDWLSRGILAAARYRKKDLAGAWALLEEAVKVAPKEGLAWSTYAWLLEKEGRHDDAIRVLGRGAAAAPKRREAQGVAAGAPERQEAQALEALRRAVVPVPARAPADGDGSGRGPEPAPDLPQALSRAPPSRSRRSAPDRER